MNNDWIVIFLLDILLLFVLLNVNIPAFHRDVHIT
jgi:hypothetical protein